MKDGKSSLNDMLEQIKKIMSEEGEKSKKIDEQKINYPDNIGHKEDGILELSEAFLLDSDYISENINKDDNLLNRPHLTNHDFLNREDTDQKNAHTKPDLQPSVMEDDMKMEKDAELLSKESADFTVNAIKDLVKAAEKPINNDICFRSGITVEQLVIDLIKPQLSKWLDDHLPNIVKDVVEKEIKKLIPKD